MKQSPNSVPVSFAAKAYGKDPSWVRAGIITGYLPIGTATRGGKQVTSIEEMDGRLGRINYYISPKLLYEETGVKWTGGGEKIPGGYSPENFVDRNRYLELKYFCLQYPIWKRIYKALAVGRDVYIDEVVFGGASGRPADPTMQLTMARLFYKERMEMIEHTVKEVSQEWYRPLLARVTTGRVPKDEKRPTDEEFDNLYALFFVKLHRIRS